MLIYFDISKYSRDIIQMDELFSTANRSIRLKEERKKLKLTQVKAAEIIGVLEASWIRYEKHGESMNEEQIYALQKYGFDMSYVLFGKYKLNMQSANSELLTLYEQVAEEQKEGLIFLAKAFAAAYPKNR